MRLVSCGLFCALAMSTSAFAQQAGTVDLSIGQEGYDEVKLVCNGKPRQMWNLRSNESKQASVGVLYDPDPAVGGDGKLNQNCSFEAGATLAQVDFTLHDPKMNHDIGQYAVSSATIDSATFATDLKPCPGDFEQRKNACYVLKPEGGTVEAGQMIEILFGNRK
jgi:hypothetical protein